VASCNMAALAASGEFGDFRPEDLGAVIFDGINLLPMDDDQRDAAKKSCEMVKFIYNHWGEVWDFVCSANEMTYGAVPLVSGAVALVGVVYNVHRINQLVVLLSPEEKAEKDSLFLDINGKLAEIKKISNKLVRMINNPKNKRDRVTGIWRPSPAELAKFRNLQIDFDEGLISARNRLDHITTWIADTLESKYRKIRRNGVIGGVVAATVSVAVGTFVALCPPALVSASRMSPRAFGMLTGGVGLVLSEVGIYCIVRDGIDKLNAAKGTIDLEWKKLDDKYQEVKNGTDRKIKDEPLLTEAKLAMSAITVHARQWTADSQHLQAMLAQARLATG